MIVQCCVCEKVREDGQWFALGKPVNHHETLVSHGYCPGCAAEAFGELYRRAQAREASRREVVHAA
ncbi:MAG: hypothetical protein SGI88_09805 [Candidatus Hydrogenedentes bacterium]|nr:hypothetical protein [Candidatus Hydrogenedentota bacterium]